VRPSAPDKPWVRMSTIVAVRATRATARFTIVALVAVGWLAVGWGAAGATDEGGEGAETGDDAAVELLRQGQMVYEANCVACHQADGRGVPGAFPPLVDNPNVADAEYVAMVIRNGRTGEIEVGGVVYDGAMPAFQLLDDAQVEAVTAYVQNDLVAPAAPGAESVGEVAGTELPFAVVVTYGLGFLVFVVVAALVAAPYVLARDDRHVFDWPRAWLKGLSIFLGVTVLTVIIPNFVLELGFVSGSPRLVQDLLGSGVWVAALALCLWGLWRGQRERML
jgi:mono/diheme cytochrome c family protein